MIPNTQRPHFQTRLHSEAQACGHERGGTFSPCRCPLPSQGSREERWGWGAPSAAWGARGPASASGAKVPSLERRSLYGTCLFLRPQVKFEMSEDTTLADLLQLNLHKYEDEVRNIVDKAVKESGMEKVPFVDGDGCCLAGGANASPAVCLTSHGASTHSTRKESFPGLFVPYPRRKSCKIAPDFISGKKRIQLLLQLSLLPRTVCVFPSTPSSFRSRSTPTCACPPPL